LWKINTARNPLIPQELCWRQQTPPEIRLFHKNFAAEVERLPNCDGDGDSDDDPLTVAAAAESSKPFLDLS
jgi:hypothetical protein